MVPHPYFKPRGGGPSAPFRIRYDASNQIAQHHHHLPPPHTQACTGPSRPALRVRYGAATPGSGFKDSRKKPSSSILVIVLFILFAEVLWCKVFGKCFSYSFTMSLVVYFVLHLYSFCCPLSYVAGMWQECFFYVLKLFKRFFVLIRICSFGVFDRTVTGMRIPRAPHWDAPRALRGAAAPQSSAPRATSPQVCSLMIRREGRAVGESAPDICQPQNSQVPRVSLAMTSVLAENMDLGKPYFEYILGHYKQESEEGMRVTAGISTADIFETVRWVEYLIFVVSRFLEHWEFSEVTQ